MVHMHEHLLIRQCQRFHCIQKSYHLLTTLFVDVLLDQLYSPGLCDHPPGLLRVEPHTLSHIVPEGRER